MSADNSVSTAVLKDGTRAKAREADSFVPIRVLFVDHTAAESGGEIALLNLVRNLDARRVTPIVVFGSHGPVAHMMRSFADTRVLPLSPLVAGAKKDSLSAASLMQIRALLNAAVYVWRLLWLIRRSHVRVVHTNSLKADLLGGIAARMTGRIVVWHVRDRIDDDYLPPTVVRAFRLLSRWIPHFVIANSQATLRSLDRPMLRSTSGKPDLRGRGFVVHDGTYLQDRSTKVLVDRKLSRIGLIGRICPWKGQHIFLHAAALVRERFDDVQFVIVGSALFGETEYERQLHQLPDRLGIADLVTFTGFRTDVYKVIDEMDLIVHASTIGEPFGQVIIEGMAAGKPIVATNGGGVPEIVDDGKTGILIPMGNIQAMAEAISRILDDPAAAIKMGERGRERVREHFTIDQTARKVEQIYQLIDSKIQS